MAWPEPPDWLELQVEPRRLVRGESVTVLVEAPADALLEHRRELGLGCLAHRAGVQKTGEIGDAGGRHRMDRQDLVYDDWRLLTRENAADPFEFLVPADAPYSYEGDVVSFYWAIWLRREFRVLDREAYVVLVVEP